MIEDELLKWRFKCGSRDALSRIYEKYLNHLLTLAMGLLNDVNMAEDVVHDVFVSFARNAKHFKLRGNLWGYLATCVANRSRDVLRRNRVRTTHKNEPDRTSYECDGPEQSVIGSEKAHRLNAAIAQLPSEQQEVVVLRLKGEMSFNEIAKCQGVPANTARGRYRYGLDKLRSILESEVEG